MKKIGFVDYYISEWHANNYPAWFKSACKEMNLDSQLAYAWAEREISPVDGKSTDEWCAEFGVQRCATIDELCEKSDVIVILAPSNPEKHLGYAERVFKWGKPTYVDKTFAPDLKTAKEIFSLSETHHTPFFSTSALRYADELGAFIGCRHLCIRGGGRSAQEYIVHQIEMAVKAVGAGASAVTCAQREGGELCFTISYPDDRSAALHYRPDYGFSLRRDEGDAETPVRSDYFATLIRRILRFFETGGADFDPTETLEVMRLRELCVKAEANPGERFE